jgi:hypothetical protein
VLPFVDSLHSGSIMYGLSAGRPAITPDTPYSRGVDRAIGPGWVVRYSDVLTPETLRTWRPPAAPACLDAFTLAQLGEGSMALYAKLTA